MPGSLLHGSWEIYTGPGHTGPGQHVPGRTGKAVCRNPAPETVEKSDSPEVPQKPSNKGRQLPAEMVEGRGEAEGNAEQAPALRILSRTVSPMGPERIQRVASLSAHPQEHRLKVTAALLPPATAMFRRVQRAMDPP
jgi:hypothetical protein